jgi:glycosyltransferase involved in cell wall biosynthesis
LSRPFVSVLIDTYNHEKFIEQAITSVLEQNFPLSDYEILVVDDGSTDRTPELVKNFAPRVVYLPKKNGGQASAFNFGIPQCRGEIVAFLDGDDWWAANKLATVIRAFAEAPSVGIVGHGTINVQRDGTEQVETLKDGFRFTASNREGALLFRRRGSFLGTSRMTIRAELLRRIGSVPEEITIQADEYLFTLAAALSEAAVLPEPLTFYRLHAGNLFQTTGDDPEKLRCVQRALALLSSTLRERLRAFGIDPAVADLVVEYTQACADRLRLRLDGGWSCETARTERTLYKILHPEARFSHRALKRLILWAALFVPPKIFYRAQSSVARNDFYHRVRARLLPVPGMEHIQRDWRTRP